MVRLQEGFLGEIFGIMPITQDPEADAAHGILIAFHRFSIGVELALQGEPYQCLIRCWGYV